MLRFLQRPIFWIFVVPWKMPALPSYLPSLKLTLRQWKLMLGSDELSFWVTGPIFRALSQMLHVSGQMVHNISPLPRFPWNWKGDFPSLATFWGEVVTYIYHKIAPNVGKYSSPMEHMGMLVLGRVIHHLAVRVKGHFGIMFLGFLWTGATSNPQDKPWFILRFIKIRFKKKIRAKLAQQS